MSPAPLSAATRARSWQVFALVLLSASYFFQSSGHNEAARFDQIRSVAERGEWWIDRYSTNTADTIQVGPRSYPGKAPGTTLLGILPWVAARVILALLPIITEQQLILAAWALTVLLAALPTALVSLMLLRFFARNGWTLKWASLLAVGYGLGTIAFPWATVFFGHQLSAFFAFGAFYLIWSSRWLALGSALSMRLAAGLMLGFLPVIEHPGAMASGLIFLYAVIALGWRACLPIATAGFLGVLPLALYNQVAFGDPLSLGYGFYAKPGSAFPAHQTGIIGVSWPQWDVLHRITFHPQRGLFYANPWLAASLIAPVFFRRMRGLQPECLLSAGIFGAFLAFNSGFGNSIVYWGGGYSFGPRHLLIAVPFAVMLAAIPVKSRITAPFIGLFIVATMLLMLAVAAIDPRFPYEPDEPFLRFYLPLFARGLFSMNPETTFDDVAIFDTTGSFNLGRIMGLPRALEILPLTLVWALAAWRFAGSQRTRGARVGRAIMTLLMITPGLVPALPGLAPWNAQEPGLCRTVSARRWPYFSSYALPERSPERPRFERVLSPVISNQFPYEAWPTVAVTDSGYFEPARAGWHLLRVDATGEAAVYVDGLLKARVEGQGQATRSRAAAVQIYLSKGPHEFIVRYMSAAPERSLKLSIAFRDGPLSPLEEGLTAGTCR